MTQTFSNKEILDGMREPLEKTGFEPDKWQQAVLDHKGSVTLRCGRQVGKTEIISRKVKKLAQDYNKKSLNVLIAAPSKNQSAHAYQMTMDLFQKEHWQFVDRATEAWIEENPTRRLSLIVKKQLERTYGLFHSEPTKSELCLKGKETKHLERWDKGSTILSMPVGKTGVYIRCKTLDILVGEEAAFIPEPVWTALLPMLSVSEKTRGFGWEILLSTPFGKGGHFFASHHSKEYRQFHISAENCPRISKEFLKKEKGRLSSTEYSQEYQANFIESFEQFFPTEVIKNCMNFMSWDYAKEFKPHLNYYLGSDIARYGKDENAFATGEMSEDKKRLRIVSAHTTERKSIPNTARHHELLNHKFNYRKIFTDSAGVGGGCYDMLVESLGKYKMVGLENATKSVDSDRKGKILKEDLYSNALKMMENGEIDIINNMDLMRSLKSMCFKYSSDRHLLIYGPYSHLSEAFVRVCWAMKNKGLKLFCA